MPLIFEATIPVETFSPNVLYSKHWTFRNKVSKKQKKYVWLTWQQAKPKITLPCIVTLTRIASRRLDPDNLQGAFKNIRDQIASLLIPGLPMGQADDDPRIEWKYKQETGTRKKEIRIEVHERREK